MSLSDQEIRSIAHGVRRLSRINTLLSNERTLLVYVRAALTFLIAGATLLHFFMGTPYRYLGRFLIVAAACVLALGFFRHKRMHRLIFDDDPD